MTTAVVSDRRKFVVLTLLYLAVLLALAGDFLRRFR